MPKPLSLRNFKVQSVSLCLSVSLSLSLSHTHRESMYMLLVYFLIKAVNRANSQGMCAKEQKKEQTKTKNRQTKNKKCCLKASLASITEAKTPRTPSQRFMQALQNCQHCCSVICLIGKTSLFNLHLMNLILSLSLSLSVTS